MGEIRHFAEIRPGSRASTSPKGEALKEHLVDNHQGSEAVLLACEDPSLGAQLPLLHTSPAPVRKQTCDLFPQELQRGSPKEEISSLIFENSPAQYSSNPPACHSSSNEAQSTGAGIELSSTLSYDPGDGIVRELQVPPHDSDDSAWRGTDDATSWGTSGQPLL